MKKCIEPEKAQRILRAVEQNPGVPMSLLCTRFGCTPSGMARVVADMRMGIKKTTKAAHASAKLCGCTPEAAQDRIDSGQVLCVNCLKWKTQALMRTGSLMGAKCLECPYNKQPKKRI